MILNQLSMNTTRASNRDIPIPGRPIYPDDFCIFLTGFIPGPPGYPEKKFNKKIRLVIPKKNIKESTTNAQV